MITEKMRVALILVGGNPDHSTAIVFGRTSISDDGVPQINWRTLLGLRLAGLVTVAREDDMTADGGWDVGLTEAGARAVAR